MKIVLASVLARYDLHVLDARPDRDRLRSFTMGPHRGVRMALRGAC